MNCVKVYISDEKDICLLMHNDIDGFEFQVLNEDGTNYDFGAFTDVFMKIYTDKSRATLVQDIPESATNGLSISGNVVTWNATYADDIKIFTSNKYYEELSYINSAGLLITVNLGLLEIR